MYTQWGLNTSHSKNLNLPVRASYSELSVIWPDSFCSVQEKNPIILPHDTHTQNVALSRNGYQTKPRVGLEMYTISHFVRLFYHFIIPPPPFFFFSLLRFAVELDSLFINEQQKKRERRHDVRDLANLATSTAMFSQLLNVDPYQTKPTID